MVVDARGRDLVTPRRGVPETVAKSSVRGRVDYARDIALVGIESEPGQAGLERLIGVPVASGFRAKVAEAVPEAADARDLVHLLLDDLPGAVLVSGYAVGAAAGHVDMRNDRTQAAVFTAGRADLCSGFRRDGTMLRQLRETGILPLPTGPVAPDLESQADPAAWHEYDTLPVGAIRRRRRMDVSSEAGWVRIDAMFRDSHIDSAGLEIVIHEYTLDVLADARDLRIEAIEAVPRVLPWMECTVAAASARALAGRTMGDLRTWVRRQLSGTSTCTHLNDVLRSLDDVDRLTTAASGSLSLFPHTKMNDITD